jgi:hypothetical protein
MKINIPAELTRNQQQELLTCSIERVFNTAISIIERSQHEDAGMNVEDLKGTKELASLLWNAARNEVFKALSP